MKRLLLALLLVGLPLAPLPLVSTGCQTAPEAVTYKTLRSVWETVHASMQVYGELYRAGKVTPETRARVVAAHNAYREAMFVAIDAAQLNWDSVAPSDVAQLAQRVLTLVASIPETP